MKILFLTTIDPGTKVGGAVFSRSVIELIRNFTQHELEVFVLDEHRLIEGRTPRLVLAALNYIATSTPLTVGYHSSFVRRGRLQRLCQAHDLVIFDHLESAAAVDCKVPYVYLMHNCEHQLFHMRLRGAKIPFASRLVSSLERYECRFISKAAGIISISYDDAVHARFLNSNVGVVLPSFPASASFQRALRCLMQDGIVRLGFLGGAQWAPNRRAVCYAIENVLTHISRPFKFIIGGKGWETYLSTLNIPHSVGQHIECLGQIDDIALYWQGLDIFLATITEGAGVNVKVCEALHMRVPVVGLPRAGRGLPVHELVGQLNLYRKAEDIVHHINAFTGEDAISSGHSVFSQCRAAITLDEVLHRAGQLTTQPGSGSPA